MEEIKIKYPVDTDGYLQYLLDSAIKEIESNDKWIYLFFRVLREIFWYNWIIKYQGENHGKYRIKK